LDDTLNISSYWGNMLMLPNGEILFTDFGNVWVYQHGVASRPKPQPDPK
jgi:hypothetical protein